MSTLSDQRRNILRHFQTMLIRWHGTTARMTELTRSHATLSIELHAPDRHGRLLIACIDPLHIHGAITWEKSNVEIDLDESDGFVVRDTLSNVEIRTGSVEVKEYP